MFEWFSPEKWGISIHQYEQWWYFFVYVFFKGFWARLIASLSLAFSVYSIVRRKFRPYLAFVAYVIAIIFTYAGVIINWLL